LICDATSLSNLQTSTQISTQNDFTEESLQTKQSNTQ